MLLIKNALRISAFPADPSCCLSLSLAPLFDLAVNMETIKFGINTAISSSPSGEEPGFSQSCCRKKQRWPTFSCNGGTSFGNPFPVPGDVRRSNIVLYYTYTCASMCVLQPAVTYLTLHFFFSLLAPSLKKFPTFWWLCCAKVEHGCLVPLPGWFGFSLGW